MGASDVTVEILKDIRDNIRGGRTELREEIRETNRRLHAVNDRLDLNNHRLDIGETTLLDLAEQQRLVVRYTKAISDTRTPCT